MYNYSVEAVLNILETNKSCGNILCSYQQYHPGKITLEVSVPMIEYLVITAYELWMM